MEHFAWQLFVAANCASSKTTSPLMWETWAEQTCLLHGGKDCTNQEGRQRLHASVLASKARDLPALCQPMTTAKTTTDSALLPFVPKNLSADPQFCEEVHVNQAEADFIMSPQGRNVKYSLQTLPGQNDYIYNNGPLSFPSSALEVKADWLPSNAIIPGFNCAEPVSSGYYVEKIGDECYALVGLHISSKLLPNWVWATFEPQSTSTNPNRCNDKLYSNCVDPWGSLVSPSNGQRTGMTSQLRNLMDAAALRRAFYNYRLVGVQTGYVNAQKQPVLLGNSFTEFNAQVPPQQASCMTCHSYASFTSNTQPIVENPNFGAFPGTPAVGIPSPLAGWNKQDFSWLLGIMPPNGTVNAGGVTAKK
ncbi:hypothetical protein LJR230_000028 [Trinickia sp. LjRoot230]|uniref:hypothetical protein n=1 Tax=Trinickia sp. LjRoot230 TaxID=3342288 RepID=UPI003ECFB258